MNDETNPAPRPRGRPRKPKPQPPQPARKSGARWANAVQPRENASPAWKRKFGDSSRWNENDALDISANRLAIPQDVIENLRREGIALQWMAETVMGQPQTHAMAVHQSHGWQHVAPGEIPGISTTQVEGMVLMARPYAIHRKEVQNEQRAAAAQVSLKREGLISGDIPGVPMDAARHPSALRSNRINRTFERLDVPED